MKNDRVRYYNDKIERCDSSNMLLSLCYELQDKSKFVRLLDNVNVDDLPDKFCSFHFMIKFPM